MAIIYNITTKNARLEVVKTALSGGGSLVIGTSDLDGNVSLTDFVLATIPLATGVGTVSGGTLTFDTTDMTCTISVTGNPAKAELRASDNTIIAKNLVVDKTNADIIITQPLDGNGNVILTSGSPLAITSASIAHG